MDSETSDCKGGERRPVLQEPRSKKFAFLCLVFAGSDAQIFKVVSKGTRGTWSFSDPVRALAPKKPLEKQYPTTPLQQTR